MNESIPADLRGKPAPLIGLGVRPQLKSDIFLNRPEIDFLELTADHYLDASPVRGVRHGGGDPRNPGGA